MASDVKSTSANLNEVKRSLLAFRVLIVTSLNRFADGATGSYTLTFFRKDLARER